MDLTPGAAPAKAAAPSKPAAPAAAAAGKKEAQLSAAELKAKKNAEGAAKAKAELAAREAAYPPEVKAAAEAVRALKEAKAGKEEIKAAVDVLVELKKKHGLMSSGKSSGGKSKGAAAAATPSPKKAAKAKGEGKASSPVSVTGTVAAPAGRPNIHTAAGLAALDARLAELSYLNGFTPSAEDAAVFQAILNGPSSVEASQANATRWFTHMCSFSQADRDAWPAVPEMFMTGRRSLLFDLSLPL